MRDVEVDFSYKYVGSYGCHNMLDPIKYTKKYPTYGDFYRHLLYAKKTNQGLFHRYKFRGRLHNFDDAFKEMERLKNVEDKSLFVVWCPDTAYYPENGEIYI